MYRPQFDSTMSRPPKPQLAKQSVAKVGIEVDNLPTRCHAYEQYRRLFPGTKPNGTYLQTESENGRSTSLLGRVLEQRTTNNENPSVTQDLVPLTPAPLGSPPVVQSHSFESTGSTSSKPESEGASTVAKEDSSPAPMKPQEPPTDSVRLKAESAPFFPLTGIGPSGTKDLVGPVGHPPVGHPPPPVLRKESRSYGPLTGVGPESGSPPRLQAPNRDLIKSPPWVPSVTSESTVSPCSPCSTAGPGKYIKLAVSNKSPDNRVGIIFRQQGEEGIFIHSISHSSLFANTSLGAGMRILSINDMDATSGMSLKGFMELLREAEGLLVLQAEETILSPGEEAALKKEKGKIAGKRALKKWLDLKAAEEKANSTCPTADASLITRSVKWAVSKESIADGAGIILQRKGNTRYNPLIIQCILQTSPFADTSLRVGMRVLRINGANTNKLNLKHAMRVLKQEKNTITIEAEESVLPTPEDPQEAPKKERGPTVRFAVSKESGDDRMGIIFRQEGNDAILIYSISESSPFANSCLCEGMQVLKINDIPTDGLSLKKFMRVPTRAEDVVVIEAQGFIEEDLPWVPWWKWQKKTKKKKNFQNKKKTYRWGSETYTQYPTTYTQYPTTVYTREAPKQKYQAEEWIVPCVSVPTQEPITGEAPDCPALHQQPMPKRKDELEDVVEIQTEAVGGISYPFENVLLTCDE